MNKKTRIKICGLTGPGEAEFLNRNGVDLAGFVLFYPKSRRNIGISRAQEIFAELDKNIKRVAVVVSPTISQLAMIKEAGFDFAQVHGALPKDEEIKDLKLIKAFNVADMNAADEYSKKHNVAALLFDAAKPGSGMTFDWSLMSGIPKTDKPFLLAGGLNAVNIKEAIAFCHPFAVDVSSSVEKPGGGKDGELIYRFVSAVREADSKSNTE